MTLTLKTAKHAINEYGKIFNIIDDADPLSAYSVNREQAIESNKLGYQFTPCIVVTTAREAFEAAWELAYEIEGDTVPSNQAYIYRDGVPFLYTVNTYGYVHEPKGSILDSGEHRLLDSPESSPEPEPWELSRFCYANGDFYERFNDASGVHWMRPGHVLYYRRKDLAKLNPKPVTIEGEAE